MAILQDTQLVQALNKAVGKQASLVGCTISTLSFSYNKADILTKE